MMDIGAFLFLQSLFSRNPKMAICGAVAAGLVGNSLFNQVKSLPSGLLAVCGSFLLFGLGTLVAWTKSKWNPTVEIEPATNRSGGLTGE